MKYINPVCAGWSFGMAFMCFIYGSNTLGWANITAGLINCIIILLRK